MFFGSGTVTPGPSREQDITFFCKRQLKSSQKSRDSTVVARRVQSVTVPLSGSQANVVKRPHTL